MGYPARPLLREFVESRIHSRKEIYAYATSVQGPSTVPVEPTNIVTSTPRLSASKMKLSIYISLSIVFPAVYHTTVAPPLSIASISRGDKIILLNLGGNSSRSMYRLVSEELLF